MAINENTLGGKWLEIKGEVQKAWGNLKDDDLEKTKGDFKVLLGLIQQKYGAAQESSSKKLTEIFHKFADHGLEKKDQTMNHLEKKLRE